MEKDQNTDNKTQNLEQDELPSKEANVDLDKKETKKNEEIQELTPDEKIKELEDKLARTFAEMENQRRRYEKEKEDAFDYGGFIFARKH